VTSTDVSSKLAAVAGALTPAAPGKVGFEPSVELK
jgi:hypothetical protein